MSGKKITTPICADAVERNFRDALDKFLEEWRACLVAEEHYEYGLASLRIEATLQPLIIEGNIVVEKAVVDLGNYVC